MNTQVIPRTRLFAAIDAGASRSLVWIGAPAGSGKTTLAASYLEDRGRRSCRLVIEPHDVELGTFFYRLRATLERSVEGVASRLPDWSAEHLDDPRAYTRRFFGVLCEELSGSWALVLDNYQAIGENNPLSAALDAVFEVLRPGIRLWILSRYDPCRVFARARTNGGLLELDAADLRFTLEETRQLLGGSWLEGDVRRVHETAEGWVAGLVLMLVSRPAAVALHAASQAERSGPGERSPTAAGATGLARQHLFDYFAVELFERLEAEEQRVLLAVAALPFVTPAMATAIAGSDAAIVVLERLRARNLFIERRPGADPSYVLHALFRAFLEQQASRFLTPVALRIRDRRAARLLVMAREDELAMQALLALRDRPAATEFLLRIADEHLASDRVENLRRWLDALREEVSAQPMLGYWRGVCELYDDPSEAARAFAIAYDALRRGSRVLDAMLALAGCCEATVMSGRNLASLDHWIERFEPHAERCLAVADASIERRLLPGLLAALVTRQPQHRLLAPLVERAERVLEQDPGARQRALFGALAGCFIDHGQHERMSRLLRRVATLGELASVTPAVRLRWLHATIFWQTLTGRVDEAREAAGAATLLCEEHALLRLRGTTAILAAQADWTGGRAAEAREHLRLARELVVADNLVDRSVVEFLEGAIALQIDQPEAAVQALRRAVTLACEAGSPGRERVARFELALALGEVLEFEAAELELATIKRQASFRHSPFHQWVVTMIEASVADRHADRAGAVEALRRGARIARTRGYRYAPGLFAAGIMPRLCRLALELGIDPPLIDEWILAGRLAPPDITCERWPWPLRIHTFGGLAIERQAVPLPRGRKRSQKPLDLLCHLVAAGGGATKRWLTSALWPELDAECAASLFDNTLHRLRRLLGVEGAIVARQAGFAIDTAVVYVDVLAYRRHVARARELLSTNESGPAFETVARELLRMAPAPFLPGEERYPVLIGVRERLQSERLRLLEKLAQRLIAAAQIGLAIELLEDLFEQDPLAERVGRSLIRCHAEAGSVEEAARVYYRLRERTGRVLGSMPAAATVALARRVGILTGVNARSATHPDTTP